MPRASMPPGWSEHRDAASGESYYYNANTGVTSWERPLAEVAATAADRQRCCEQQHRRLPHSKASGEDMR